MAINRRAGNVIDCLAADTKPSLSIDASLLIEKDTQKLFVLDTSWKEINYLSLDGGTVTGNLNIHDHTDKGITLSYGDPVAYLSTQGALQIEADLGYIAIGGPLFGAQPIELLDNVCINGHITCPYSLYIGSPDIGTLADSGTTFQVGGNSLFQGHVDISGDSQFKGDVTLGDGVTINPVLNMKNSAGGTEVRLTVEDLEFHVGAGAYAGTANIVKPPFGFKRVVRNVFEATYDYTQVTTSHSTIFTLPANSRILSIEYSSNLDNGNGDFTSTMLLDENSDFIVEHSMIGDSNSSWKTVSVYADKRLLNEYTSSSETIKIAAEDTFTQGEIKLRIIIETKL